MWSSIDFSSISTSWQFLLNGGIFTLSLTAATAVGGILLGVLIALGRLSSCWWLRIPATIYVNAIRAIPLVLMLFWFFFLMPVLLMVLTGSDHPIEVGAGGTAVVTFILFEAAYFAEIIRAGISSIGAGQFAAAEALGMPYWPTMRYIILPQALRRMLPVIFTQILVVFQDTSLVYVISANDFLGACSKIAQRDGQLVLMYSFAAIVYFVISLILSRMIKRYQQHHALRVL